jgi:hypothetical protein
VAATDDLTPPEESAYTAANISVNERQIALIDKTRVVIEEMTAQPLDDPEEPGAQ